MSVAVMLFRLRTNSIAETTSTKQMASWPTTSPRWSVARRRSTVCERPPLRSTASGSNRDDWNAGNNPNTNAVTATTTAATAAARQSMPNGDMQRIEIPCEHHRRASGPPRARAAGPMPRRHADSTSASITICVISAATRCAERDQHRQLAAPRMGARQHQRRQVGDGQQQDQPGGAEQQPERRLVGGAQPADAVAGIDTAVKRKPRYVSRLAGLWPGGSVASIRPGLSARTCSPACAMRDAGRQAPHHVQPPEIAPLVRLTEAARRADRQGDVKGAADLESGKVRRRDADDRETLLQQRDRRAKHGAIAAEPRLPEGVTEHDRAFASRSIVGGGQQAAMSRRQAQRGERLAAEVQAANGHGIQRPSPIRKPVLPHANTSGETVCCARICSHSGSVISAAVSLKPQPPRPPLMRTSTSSCGASTGSVRSRMASTS